MRPLPPNFIKESFAEETGEAFLALITINHADFAAPIRISTDARETVSRGMTFVPYPVQPFLPSDEHGVPPMLKLKIDNIDREISAAIRSASMISPPTVLIEMVLSSTPDEVVASYSGFRLERISYDVQSVEAELTLRQYGREPYPAWSFTPGRFPSMYRQL